MGIDNHLKVIKEGVFGRDVRQAIHDGIQQVYDDATANGNANMEVAQARGQSSTLANRLDTDRQNIYALLQDLPIESLKGKVTAAMLADDVIKKIAGTAPVNATVADKSLTSEKFATGSVDGSAISNSVGRHMVSVTKNRNIMPELLFTNASSNLFDRSRLTDGMILGAGGKPTVYARGGYTDYIPIKPNTKYYSDFVYGNQAGAFYNESLGFISEFTGSGTDSARTFLTPPNAYFMRLNIPNWGVGLKSDFMICEGDKPLVASVYGQGKIEGLLVNAGAIDGLILPEQNRDFIFDNYINADEVEKNKWIKNDGTSEVVTTVSMSRLIYVQAGDVYATNFDVQHPGAYFDATGKWIASITYDSEQTISGWKTFTVPSGMRYIRLNIRNTFLQQAMLVKGKDVPSSYRAYAYHLKGSSAGSEAPLSGTKILTIGDSITWLDGKDYAGSHHIGYQEVLRQAGAIITNTGHSGATYRKYKAEISNQEHGSIHDDIVGANYDVSSFDVITLFGMTNDVARGWVPGTFGSINDSSFDLYTSIGALRSLVEYLRTKNPTAKIILFTPIRSTAASRPDDKMKEAADAIINIANEYGLPWVDLYRTSGIGKGTFDIYLYDGTHPTNEGFKMLGERFLGEIRRVIGK